MQEYVRVDEYYIAKIKSICFYRRQHLNKCRNMVEKALILELESASIAKRESNIFYKPFFQKYYNFICRLIKIRDFYGVDRWELENAEQMFDDEIIKIDDFPDIDRSDIIEIKYYVPLGIHEQCEQLINDTYYNMYDIAEIHSKVEEIVNNYRKEIDVTNRIYWSFPRLPYDY